MEIRVSGRLSIANVAETVDRGLEVLRRSEGKRITVDLSDTDYLDTAGAAALVLLQQRARDGARAFSFRSVTEEMRSTLDMIDAQALAPRGEPKPMGRRRRNPVERLGAAALRLLDDFLDIVGFLGAMIRLLLASLLRPTTIRWSDTLRHIREVGAGGLPLVGLIGFLMGVIVGMLTVTQMAAYQARNVVGAVIGIGMLKEFSPFITAILVAGRSGSAFAADIGTMMINREVDALVIMGFDPERFLVVPRFLAVLVAVPLLTVLSDILGLAGGLGVTLLTLDLSASAFLRQVASSLSVSDFLLSLLKSASFAAAIVSVGCLRGFDTHHGSQEVARSTTSAVVTAIVLVILIDFLFSWITYYF